MGVFLDIFIEYLFRVLVRFLTEIPMSGAFVATIGNYRDN
jgi:hypothetical protein